MVGGGLITIKKRGIIGAYLTDNLVDYLLLKVLFIIIIIILIKDLLKLYLLIYRKQISDSETVMTNKPTKRKHSVNMEVILGGGGRRKFVK